jgi:hypothetical protein
MRRRQLLFIRLSLASSATLSLALMACAGDDSNPAASTDGGSHDATASSSGASSSGTSSSGTSSSGTSSSGASSSGGSSSGGSSSGSTDGGADGGTPLTQALVTTIEPGVTATAVLINQGTAIGEGENNGATPVSLTNVAEDPNNTSTITAFDGGFTASGTVPDTAAGFCDYPADGGAPTRHSYVTGSKFETVAADGGPDPMVLMAPYYFPLVYTSALTTTGNVVTGAKPIIGLFDWRPKDIDEAVVVAESDDMGQTWFFMQTVLELFPDYSNPISGGYVSGSTNTGCPSAITSTNANATSVSGSNADDGWGHAAIITLPGVTDAGTGSQFLYLLDRNTNNMPDSGLPYVDNAPLHVINLVKASNKFPIWNTNNPDAGANDIKSISSALDNTSGTDSPVVVQNTNGLLNPDGIMAVFPTDASAAAGSAITVMYVQKIVNGDNTGSTALPTAQQCTAAPFSGKTNHDISNVRLATTTDGVNFTDLGIVEGLNDPTTVDYTKTRWISPRATLIDINGDQSRWGMYFSGGNCLDGDSDAFHFIGYAESVDKMHWTVFNDINHPLASINTITTTNQATGTSVTVPATPPIIPTEFWFAERLYAPTAVQMDSTHLSMTFAGYGVQTPSKDLLDYRQIGNVVLTVSRALPATTPNNINAH